MPKQNAGPYPIGKAIYWGIIRQVHLGYTVCSSVTGEQPSPAIGIKTFLAIGTKTFFLLLEGKQMSTKIYYAYKVHSSAMNRFMAKFDAIVFKSAVEKIRCLLSHIINSKQDEIENICKSKYEKYSPQEPYEKYASTERKNTIALEMTLFELAKTSFSSYRDPDTDIDASFNAFFYKDFFYVIPYGEIKWDKQGFTKLKGVEDYAYWNNVDEPKGISYKDWQKRGKVWDKVATDDWEKNRFVHESINLKDHINMTKIIKMATTEHEIPIKVSDGAPWTTYKSEFKEKIEGEFWYERIKKKKETQK